MNSFNRVQGFILQPDIAPVDELPEPGIKIENGNFRWAGAQETTLKNININAKKGELIMVVGPVGSGKSSIISSVLGEITKESGTAAVGGSIAYVAQEAYIFNSSVRENIIFGKPFDDVKYRKVLEASALMSDLAQFVAGDRTEIGERGVNLSGGQKQRVAIARALYSDADVILLDDPLSAVDAHVGKHLFKKAVRGMLTDRLVVLATNQLQYLPFADKVLFLSGGEVVAEGTFHDLIKSSKAFAEQMEKYGVTGEKVEEEDTDEEKRYNDAPKKDVSQNFSKPEVKDHVINGPSNGVGAFKKEKKSKKSKKDKPVEEAKPADKAQLIQSEGKQTGLVEFSVYWYYFKKGGLFSFAVMILFFAFSVGARVTGSWWLTVWTTGGTNSGIFLPLWQCTFYKLYKYSSKSNLALNRHCDLQCIHRW
jgi:ATP-binding cassette subfamily C (CFTR/MRP) protein 1